MMRKAKALIAAAFMLAATPAFAAEFILITHSDGTDPFWPVVQRGAEDAAKRVGVTLTYRHPNRVDAPEMAQIIEASIAQKPDAMIISILDPEVIGPAIKGRGRRRHSGRVDQFRRQVCARVRRAVPCRPARGRGRQGRGRAGQGRRRDQASLRQPGGGEHRACASAARDMPMPSASRST